MSRSLVVFYSRTGNTRVVARALADRLGADLEEIRERGSHAGASGFLRGILDSLLRRSVPIEPGRDLSGYQTIIVGSPVWASLLASPVRAWLRRSGALAGRFAAFSVSGGGGTQSRLFDEVARLAGKRPDPVLSLAERDLAEDRFQPRLAAFAEAIRAAAAKTA